MYKNKIPIEEIELKYKIKKGLIFKKPLNSFTWDYTSDDELIKCKVDKENEYNVIYQSSFYPEEEFYDNYLNTMNECPFPYSMTFKAFPPFWSGLCGALFPEPSLIQIFEDPASL